jgi:transposase
MKALTLSDASMMLLALQDEIRRSEDARYDHRLHAVLLVAQGESCREVARLLGDAPRSVENWVHRFEARGFAGLLEGERSGRPSRLSAPQLERIGQVLRGSPRFVGIEAGLWDGKTLSAWIEKELGVELKTRQCQRLFRQLRFRLRKPAPMVAPKDPVKQANLAERKVTHKKTPRPGAGSRS